MSVRRVELLCTLAAQFDPIYFHEENKRKTKGKKMQHKKKEAVTNYLITVWLWWTGGKEEEKFIWKTLKINESFTVVVKTTSWLINGAQRTNA